jgi:hypothetical protein
MFARVKKSGAYQYLQLVENRWENGQSRQRVITTLGRLDQIACEMWPGNTADVTSTIPVVTRLKKRFGANRFCIVADRGMISKDTMLALVEAELSYILGVRMRLVKEVKTEVLADETPYEEVYPEGIHSKDPSPLKVKEVVVDGTRYIVCKNERQSRRDEADRNTIVESLKEKIAKVPSSLISNKGYRGFLTITNKSVALDEEKVKVDAKYDGIWVLTTNTKLKAREVALKYKELWMVEHTFRDMKSVIDTRPIYHKRDETIRGHVFCSFLALVLKKELDDRLVSQGLQLEWADIKTGPESPSGGNPGRKRHHTGGQDRMPGDLRQGVQGNGCCSAADNQSNQRVEKRIFKELIHGAKT